MMAGFMSYFGGRRDPKQSSRDAIVTFRQQLQMIEKKEDYLQKKIDEEMKKAKANAVSNKAGECPPSALLVSLRLVLRGHHAHNDIVPSMSMSIPSRLPSSQHV